MAAGIAAIEPVGEVVYSGVFFGKKEALKQRIGEFSIDVHSIRCSLPHPESVIAPVSSHLVV